MSLIQYFHIACESIFTICCLCMIVYVLRTRKTSEGPAKAIIGLLIADSVMNMGDAMDYAFRGVMTDVGRVMISCGNFFLYLSAYAIVFFATAYMSAIIEHRGGGRKRIIATIIFALCALGVILVILSRLFGFYYVINDNNVYERLDSFWIHLFIAELAGVLLLIGALINRSKFKKRELSVILCLCLLPDIANIIQMFYFGISFNVFALFIAVLLVVVVYKWTISEKEFIHESIRLTALNIDLLSEDMDQFMKELDIDSKTRLRTRLKMEESLLRIQDKYGEDKRVNFTANMPFGKPRIKIEVGGEAFNPLMRAESEAEDWSAGLLNSTGINPNYSYFAGVNVIRLLLPTRRINPALKALITVVIGLLTGYLGTLILSPDGQAVFIQDVLIPTYEVFVNILYCVSSPIIFLMLVTTILNTGSISEQGGSSAIILGRYLGLAIFMGFIAILVTSIIMNIDTNADDVANESTAEFIRKIINIVPKNLVDPFINVNTPQLILMSLVLGFALLAVGNRGKDLTTVIRQANMVAMRLAEWISRLIPYFAFLVMALVVMNGQIKTGYKITIVLLIAILLSMACAAVILGYVSVRKKVGFISLVKKCGESLVIAFRTGSASAAYGSAEKCCTESLGIKGNYSEESLPLGTVLYMPANVIGAICFVIYAASASDVGVTPIWIVLAVVYSVILIAATPPIPGANFLAYMVMIPELGINKEFVVIVLIFEVFFGPFAVALNQLMLQMEMILQADKTGLLDKEVLRS